MTQPVQEPTNQRSISGLKWRTNQLERRPAPVSSSANLPWVRIARRFADSNQNINHNSYTEIDTTTDWNIGAGESGEGYFTVSHSDNLINVEVDAVILIHARAYWNSAITNPWILWVNVSMSANIVQADFAGMGGTTDDAGDLEFHTRVVSGTDISWGVFQKDGAVRAIDAAMLDVMVIGTYTGTDFDAMDPDFA